MSAIVSSGMRRARRPASERSASVGIIARARAMMASGVGACARSWPLAATPRTGSSTGAFLRAALLGGRHPLPHPPPYYWGGKGGGIARQTVDQHVGRHDVAERQIERAERVAVVLVGHRCIAVG